MYYSNTLIGYIEYIGYIGYIGLLFAKVTVQLANVSGVGNTRWRTQAKLQFPSIVVKRDTNILLVRLDQIRV